MKKEFGMITIILLIEIIFLSCNHVPENKSYEFKRYLKEVHKLDTKNDGVYLIFTLACFDCARDVLKIVSEMKKSATFSIILVGETSSDAEKYISELSKTKIKIYYDFKFKALKYNLGIEKALIVHFKNGECRYYKSIANYEPGSVEYLNSI